MAIDPNQYLQSTGLDVNNPEFLKQYAGQTILTGEKGTLAYRVEPTGVVFLGDVNPTASGSGLQQYQFEPGQEEAAYWLNTQQGLQPFGKPAIFDVEEGFKFIGKESEPFQTAEAGGFGKGTVPTADQYTGRTMGTTTGGKQLYELKDGSTTATPPPTGALTGGGVVPGFENISTAQAGTGAVSMASFQEQEQPDPLMQQISGANPDAIANKEFINALYQAGFKRDATQQELDIYTQRTVKDASNIILGQDRSPFGTGSTTPLTEEQRTGTETLPGAEQFLEGGLSVSDTYDDLLSETDTKPIEMGDNPVTTYYDNYKELLNEMGVPDIKSKFNEVNAEFTKLQDELNDKISDVNDNPWLTEGIRVRRTNSLKNRFEGKLSNLTNQMKLYNSLYEQGIEEARFIAGVAQDQYEFNTNTQIKLAQLAQDQAEAEAKLLKQDTVLTTGAGGQRLLINKQTGEVIANLGMSTKGTTSRGRITDTEDLTDTEIPEPTPAEERILSAYNVLGFNLLSASPEFKATFTRLMNKTQRDNWAEQYKQDQDKANITLDPERHLEDWLNTRDEEIGTDETSFLDE